MGITSPNQSLDVMPLLYVKNYSGTKVLERWAIRFAQTVATKYIIIKTFDRLPNEKAVKCQEGFKSGIIHGQFILYGEKLPAEF